MPPRPDHEFQAAVRDIISAIDRMTISNTVVLVRRGREPEVLKQARAYISKNGPFGKGRKAGLLIRDLVEYIDANHGTTGNTMQKPFDEALAELVSQYAKSGSKGGTLTLEQINELMRSQIQANEESGEE